MRKTVLRIAASIIAIFSIVGMATAQSSNPLPGSGWYTTAQIQNVSSQSGNANVTLQVYPLQGASSSQVSSVKASIPQGGGVTFFPGSGGASGNVDVSPQLQSNFQGSMVVLSDREVVAIGQINNRRFVNFNVGVDGGFAAEQYRGSEAKSSTLIFPIVKNKFGDKTTVFAVQAAGANVTYTATIKASNGVTYTKSGSINANRSTILIPSDFKDSNNNPMPSANCGTDPNTSPCFGAITVVASGGNIAGTAIEFRDNVSPATAVQASTMFSSADAGTRILCPLYRNAYPTNNERTTGIAVANVSSTNTVTFDLVLSPVGSGNPVTITEVVSPGGSITFFRHLNTGNPLLPGPGTLASATIIAAPGSSNSLVAVVSDSNFPGTGSVAATAPQKQTTYTCFNPDQATNKVAAPIFKKNAGNNTTGLQIQNANPPGGSSFEASLNFVCVPIGSTSPVNTYTITATSTITPGAAVNIFNPTQVPDGQLCSVTITAPAGNKMVVIANESSDFFPGTDTFLLNTKNYEGFNLP